MKSKSSTEELYKEINNLKESLDILKLLLIANRLLKEKAVEANEFKKRKIQEIITKHGESLDTLATQLTAGGQNKSLAHGIQELHRAERNISQLEIMKVLFEEKLKRTETALDVHLNEEGVG